MHPESGNVFDEALVGRGDRNKWPAAATWPRSSGALPCRGGSVAVATGETTARRCKMCKIPKVLRAKCEDCETHQSSRSRTNESGQFRTSGQHVMLGVEAACQLSVLHSGFGLHVGNRRNNNIMLKTMTAMKNCNDDY